jgi:ATP-dependent DNA helicase PIF1
LCPIVLFSNGQKRCITYQYYQNEEYPSIVIGQIPLCLAWALTIHKIQGATLEMADMDLGKSVFEYGQSYVALSRIKSLDGLYISEFYPHRIKANPIVKHFYERLLLIE